MSKASADKSPAKGKEVPPVNRSMKQPEPIPEDEEDLVQITNHPTDMNNKDLTNHVLVGKIITSKPQSKQGIRNAFSSIWEPYTNVYVSEISNNIYSFTFEEESEVEEALDNSPFFILNNLLSVQRWGSAKTCYENPSLLFVPSPFGPDLIKQAVVPPDGSNYWNANIQQQRETDEGEDRDGDKKSQRLDLASESELILTWNHRLNLKRNRVAGVSLDDVEEELIKRKKMKKESWFDDDGKLICVTVSSVLGNQTFMVDEEGGLRPNSP